MERRDVQRHKSFTRRSLLLGGGQMLALSALVGRLYYLQVMQADQYKVLSDDNRINLRLLAPPRGRLLDRFGVELAANRLNYQVELIREQTDSVAKTLDALARLMTIEDYQRARVLKEVEHKRRFVPVMVAENLTWEEFARINVHSPDLPGVQLDVGETRDYPLGAVTAHLTGYVAAVSDQDDSDDPLLELPGFRVGRSGIEKVYDLKLRGKAGDSEVEVNAYGRVIRELSRNEGQPGENLVLTIDSALQRFAYERLAGERAAAAVVLDVVTGDVLSMVSVPSFDPNAFNVGISADYWKSLTGNPQHPLTNKAIAGQYPPGSTFKLMVAAAGLENAVISPEQTVFCHGSVELGNHTFNCWKHGGHGTMNMTAAIEQSCDVYFYEVARRLGIDAIAATATRFGLGSVTGIDLPGERPGLIPTRRWKQVNRNESWQQGETLVAGIGQGFVSVTPLQLALMTARIANGGYAVTPRLVRPRGELDSGAAILSPGQREVPLLKVAQTSLNQVRLGMQAVTSGARGTARRTQIREPGFAMAGKTGSSQIARITKRQREAGLVKQEQLPWEQRDHALFVAYAPLEAPRYAIAVVVEHGAHGANAGMYAHDIMLKCEELDPSRRPGRARFAADGAPTVSEG